MQNKDEIQKFSGLYLPDGRPVYTQEYVQHLRDEDTKHPETVKAYIAQKGAQENMLAANVDILICGGSRGGPLEENTIVITREGGKKVKDVTERDIVYDFNHEECVVLKNVCYGALPCFRITLENGLSFDSSYDHVWPVFWSEGPFIVFLNTRDLLKANKTNPAYLINIDSERVKIKSVIPIGIHNCYCLAVDSRHGVFSLHGGIMTHNSKSFSLLMEVLKDIANPNFTAILLRKESKDLDSLINDSYKLYSDFGLYNKSINDMTWNFNNGGWLKFSYYDGMFQKFKDRFQGRQYAFVGIDEITQCEYKKFKYLTTVNRNASHIRSRFWGTCNPDPDSWVRKFIDWWIDEDGYAIPERCGKPRYCYMDGDSPDSIFWGNTREEVYAQCPSIIDAMWNDKLEDVYASIGMTKLDVLIKSVTFVRADLSENIKLISSDPSYLGNLAQQDEEQRMRDLQACWNWKAAGDDMIKYEDMEEFFHNPVQEGDGVRRASADIAFTGGDNFVMWLWVGDHISDLVVMRLDPKTVVSVVDAKLREWGVEERNLTYDMQGIGQYFKGFFPEATPFNNQAAPISLTKEEREGIRFLYKDLKSQCAFLFYKAVKEKTISIDRALLERKFSGDGYKNWTLDRILQKERKAIRRDESGDDKGFHILTKKIAKKYVGHSPDFIESLYYIFLLTRLSKKKHTKANGLWMF
jgi:hypothetical protein